MKTKLSKTPLTYVLIQIKISKIMELESKYISKLQEEIRKDFPIFDKFDIQMIEVKPQSEASIRKSTQWHFADKDTTTGILLDNDAISIHTSKYDSFEILIEKFKKVLEKFNAVLDITLSMRLGLRYINIIHPNPNIYIKESLLGFHMVNEKGFKDIYLLKTDNTQETDNGIIKIKTAHFSNKNVVNFENSTDIFVPPDLKATAQYLNFNHHQKTSPDNEYVMLDIDHYFEKSFDFDVLEIMQKLEQLHTDIKTVFNRAVTEQALRAWQ